MNFSYFFALEQEIPQGVGIPHFSAVHLLWLASITMLLMGMALVFLRLPCDRRRRMLSICAAMLLALEVVRMVWLMGSGRFDLRYMLPLHLCGIMLFVEVFAVLSENALARELSYCLGMPGAFFALLTPESTAYPLFNLWYLLFVATHSLLLLIPVLLLLDGLRPSRCRLPRCLGALLGIIAIDLMINRLLDANYLFLSRPPPGSLLAIFAHFPQPLYLVSGMLLILVVWGLLYLPWDDRAGVTLRKRI